jgi:hypothetical protein
MLIITSDKRKLGKTRSEIETNLRKEWGSSRLTEEQIDKCKFVEKKTRASWVDADIIKIADKVKGD